MSFRIKGLPAERFEHLFRMSDEELKQHGAVRKVADQRDPGYPCRVSLTDSKPNEELILVNFEHLPVDFSLPHALCDFRARGGQNL